ncbi:hypothetical protein A7K50_12430 [Dehalobacter sp. MCB1]|uniref:hypothetical protein n=1 Tax=Dehalobacter sp. MCB1 TaxID=1844756 RepID=UPI000E6C56C2|nr:hypothetical protein [Dehalobacter sp. MCB1]RJE46824.1 hypothetical protein A7K50_12430 [Dehalobacter sp. MCB1]
MRSQLQPFLGCKYPFSATVDAFGLRKVPYRGDEPTICLRDVLLYAGSFAVPVDHIWAYVGKSIARFNPRKGDRISFNAWVREYTKLNKNTGEEKIDYCIDRLSAFSLIKNNGGPDFMTFWGLMRNSSKFISDALDDVIQPTCTHLEMAAPLHAIVAQEVI